MYSQSIPGRELYPVPFQEQETEVVLKRFFALDLLFYENNFFVRTLCREKV